MTADVGLVDVSWQKKHRSTREIRELSQERSKKLGRLDRDAARLLEDAVEDQDDQP